MPGLTVDTLYSLKSSDQEIDSSLNGSARNLSRMIYPQKHLANVVLHFYALLRGATFCVKRWEKASVNVTELERFVARSLVPGLVLL